MKKIISFSNFSEADTHKTQDGKTAKKGLWYNINQRKKKGLAAKKPGSDGYPKTLDIEAKEAVYNAAGKKLVIPRTGNPRGTEPKTEGGLWDNIHKRRKAGKAPKKPGQKGYPKTLDIEAKEGYVSAAQRMAVHATKADGGKGHPDNKKKLKAHKIPGKTKGPHKEGAMKRISTGDGLDTYKPKPKNEGAMKRMSTGDGMDTYKKKPVDPHSNAPHMSGKERAAKAAKASQDKKFGPGGSYSKGGDAIRKVLAKDKNKSSLPRQMKDPKKDAMVSKGGKVKVIDKSKEDDHLKKGYVRAEHMISKELYMKVQEQNTPKPAVYRLGTKTKSPTVLPTPIRPKTNIKPRLLSNSVREATTMMVTHPMTPNKPMQITVDQWPAFKLRGYHHAEQKEHSLNIMKLLDKMKKASPAAKKALEAPSRVKSPNVTYDKNGNVIKESVECVDCECNPCECGDWREDMGPQSGGMSTEDAEGLGEALDMKQRLARGRSARKNKSKLAMGRKKAGRRIASMKVLKKRARRAARKTLTKRLTKGVAKSDLSVSRKREIEKRLDKPAFKIKANRLVKRTIKDIRKKEIARKRK